MKKMILKSVKTDLSERILTKQQMDELTGGAACPRCGFVFEPEDIALSTYDCYGTVNGQFKEMVVMSQSQSGAIEEFLRQYPSYSGASSNVNCVSRYEYESY